MNRRDQIEEVGRRRRAEWDERRAARREPRTTVSRDGREARGHGDPRSSIWTRLRDHGQRGQPAINYEAIIGAAIDLADAEGAKAITMRAIAARLGVGTMSLYWYVPSKDDLMDLVLDAVRGEIDVPDPGTGDWRTDLATISRNTRKVMLAHRWLLSFVSSGTSMGPKSLRIIELQLSYLDYLSLDPKTAIFICLSVDTYVSGFVLREQQEDEMMRPEERIANYSEMENQRDEFIGLLEGYPHVQGLVRAGVDPDALETRDDRFEFGLSSMLDGIASRIAKAQTNS